MKRALVLDCGNFQRGADRIAFQVLHYLRGPSILSLMRIRSRALAGR